MIRPWRPGPNCIFPCCIVCIRFPFHSPPRFVCPGHHTCRPRTRRTQLHPCSSGTDRPRSSYTSMPTRRSKFQQGTPRTFQRRAWSREGTGCRRVGQVPRPCQCHTRYNLMRHLPNTCPPHKSCSRRPAISDQPLCRAFPRDNPHKCRWRMPRPLHCIFRWGNHCRRRRLSQNRTCRKYPVDKVSNSYETVPPTKTRARTLCTRYWKRGPQIAPAHSRCNPRLSCWPLLCCCICRWGNQNIVVYLWPHALHCICREDKSCTPRQGST